MLIKLHGYCSVYMDVKLVYNFKRRTEADGVRKEGHRDNI